MVVIDNFNISRPFLCVDKVLRTFGFLVLICQFWGTIYAQSENNLPPNVYYLRWAKPNPDRDCNNTNQYCITEDSILSFEILYGADKELEVGDFTIYLNETALPNSRSKAENERILMGGGTFSAKVTLKQADNTLYIKAGNQTTSVLKVHYNMEKSTLYVLAAGVKSNLKYPDSDARKVIEMFKEQAIEGGMYNVDAFHVPTEKVTKGELKGRILRMKKERLKPNDIFMLYLSSHGELRNNIFYFRCVDFNRESFEETTLSEIELRELLADIHCKKLIFIDACRSDGSKGDNFYTEWSTNIDADAFFISCSNGERSYECDSVGMATFTYAILQGLAEGLADINKDSLITLNELKRYVEETTPKINERYKLAEIQHPKATIENVLANKPFYRYTGKKLPKAETIIAPKVQNEDELSRAEENFAKDKFREAFPIYLKFMNKLSPSQMYALGYMYINGEGTPTNKNEAIKWFLKAENLGEASAMFELGKIYEADGNKQEALKWYKKAMDSGNDEAQERFEQLSF